MNYRNPDVGSLYLVFYRLLKNSLQREIHINTPREQSVLGQHGAHLGPVGPRWAPCWPHEPCCQGPFQEIWIPRYKDKTFMRSIYLYNWNPYTPGHILLRRHLFVETFP